MKKILTEIQDGTFASKWINENKVGRSHFNACRRIEAEHQLEAVGRELRKMYAGTKNNNQHLKRLFDACQRAVFACCYSD